MSSLTPPSVSATADAYTRDGTYSSTNFGTSASLVVKSTGTTGLTRRAYLKFPVASLLGAESVDLVLRVEGLGTEGTSRFIAELRQVTNDSWTETGITWSNQPTSGALISVLSLLPQDVENEISIDVSGYVAQQAAGDGTASFVLLQPPNTNRTIILSAREGAHSAKLESASLLQQTQVLSTSSGRTHASAGGFSIPAADVECRADGSGSLKLQFQLDEGVNRADVRLISGNAALSAFVIDGTSLTASFQNVADRQTLKVGVVTENAAGVVSPETIVSSFILYGDANSDGQVNIADAVLTRGRIGQALTSMNFRSDVNCDGVINNLDYQLLWARSGNRLP